MLSGATRDLSLTPRPPNRGLCHSWSRPSFFLIHNFQNFHPCPSCSVVYNVVGSGSAALECNLWKLKQLPEKLHGENVLGLSCLINPSFLPVHHSVSVCLVACWLILKATGGHRKSIFLYPTICRQNGFG